MDAMANPKTLVNEGASDDPYDTGGPEWEARR